MKTKYMLASTSHLMHLSDPHGQQRLNRQPNAVISFSRKWAFFCEPVPVWVIRQFAERRMRVTVHAGMEKGDAHERIYA